MKKVLLFVLILLLKREVSAQYDSASVLTNENYFLNPIEYLADLNSSNLSTGILIDRVHYGNGMLNITGEETSATIDFQDWLHFYENLKYANVNQGFLPPVDDLEEAKDLLYRSNRVYPIGIIDFEFNRIKQSALDNEELLETEEGLLEAVSTLDSYSNEKAIASSILSNHIYGDNVTFYVGDMFYFSNNNTHTLQKVEIDFGNGRGFQTVNMNSEVTASYGSASTYIIMAVKLTYKDNTSNELESVTSRSTFFKTGSSTVPQPDDLPTGGKTGYYPDVSTIDQSVDIDGEIITRPVKDFSKARITYNIIYAPQNIDKRELRRPIIICDGFDPGNKRGYYEINASWKLFQLPKEKDGRGLYQLINGDPSPWYNTKPSAQLIGKLQADGYDIVIINFPKGAGDIIDNAGLNGLRGFFNDVINGPIYRDNKTEENVLIGPSMGGIITRLMLISMEAATPYENHFVKTWISFDSPQKGANISTGMQHSINYMGDKLNDPKLAGPLRTIAAKQMLLTHYKDQPHSLKFDQLYDDFLRNDYPVYSKNYAISNGGNGKLYPNNGAQIVDFELAQVSAIFIRAYAHNNQAGNRLMFDGYDLGGHRTYYSDFQVGYDNAPGGWYATPYLINCHYFNARKRSETNIQFTRATFMVTSSAFGKQVTYDNVYKTWQDYTGKMQNLPGKIMTPFDVVYGINGENEEHVRISLQTGNHIRDNILRSDFSNAQRPIARPNEVIHQKVNGKVAYTARQTFKFAGNGNNFTANGNADIRMNAGEAIEWLPGFETEVGASIVAEIKPINYGTVLRSSAQYTQTVHYGEPSPYKDSGQVNLDEDEIKAPKELNESNFSVKLFPNPVKEELKMSVEGFSTESEIKLEIYNASGELMYTGMVRNNSTNRIDVSTFASGLYHCRLKSGNSKTVETKFIKNQ